MNTIISEITNWLHTRQDWLQEVAQRLLKTGALSDVDIQEIVALLKTEEGQKVTKTRTFPELGATSSENICIRVDSIGNIEGIENLVSNKTLNFGNGNLSVIYGHNASGKSGYTRILKKLCCKRGARELLPNVFKGAPDVQQCEVKYTIGEDSIKDVWTVNASPIAALQNIDFFDGDAVNFYVNLNSEATYTPELLLLFENIVTTCDKIRARLDLEKNNLKNSLPQMPNEYTNTEIARQYTSLQYNTSDEQLSLFTKWTDKEQNKLDDISERLKTKDPNLLAKDKRAQQIQVNNILISLQNAINILDQTACENILSLKKIAQDKRITAVEAAQAYTTNAQLGGIGEPTWLALWNAAKAFSIEHAYKEQPFPKIDNDARCVLCHQVLDKDAQERMKSFEEYVQGSIEKKAEIAQKAYDDAISNLPKVHEDNTIKTQLLASNLEPEIWEKPLIDFWQMVNKVKEDVQKATPQEIVEGVVSPTSLIETLQKKVEELEECAKQYDDDAKSFDRDKKEQEQRNLKAQHWCSQQIEEIKKEVERLKQCKKYDDWKSATNTTKITSQAKNISKELITPEYVRRFNAELVTLKAHNIEVELIHAKSSKGKAIYHIQLKNLVQNHGLSTILSDGEKRIVALAGFLADVTGNQQKRTFIFDDPISSLDHDFEQAVAKRLVQLAQERQVLVFTHRLSLCGSIRDATEKYDDIWKKTHLTHLYIQALLNTAGHPVSEAVWNVKPKRGIILLLKCLNEAKIFLDNGDTKSYNMYIQAICSDFRKLLERLIEHDLLNGIVLRHRKSVTTKNKILYLPKITDNDCILLDDLITKYSKYEHSHSDENPVCLPDIENLAFDLNSIKDWQNEFKKRINLQVQQAQSK